MNKLEIERAKMLWPGVNSQELDLLLWACTPYPTGELPAIEEALKIAYEKSGGDVLIALEQADKARTG